MVLFTSGATEMMARRAQQTRGMLAGLMDEFGEFGLPALVKIGFPTPDDGREHMWCSVHGVSDKGVDATLENQPHNVPKASKGMRRVFPWEMMTDWMIMSPTGAVSPRSVGAARRLREAKDDLRRMIAGDQARR